MNPVQTQALKTSIQNVFSTMFQLPIEICEPITDQESTHCSDVSGIIGLSGAVVGTIVLSMPIATAQAIVDHFTGHHPEVESHDFADAIGEIVNMIAGSAKAAFQSDDVSISCPSVVIGKGHTISHQSGVPLVLIPCETECGRVFVEVSLRESHRNISIPNSAA